MIFSTDQKLKTHSSIHQDKKHAHGVNEGANKKQDQLDDKADVNITEIAPLFNADDEIVTKIILNFHEPMESVCPSKTEEVIQQQQQHAN